MKCDVCNCNETYIKDYEHNYNIKGKKINFVMPRRFCKNCNNLVYDSELDNNASLKAIEIYNKLYGLDKEKIVELRHSLKLSQDLFAKIIGCAKKTLISYEKGTAIPNDNYLIIIKCLIAKPDTIITLVNANKEQFTNREYNKIQNNFEKYSSNNIKNLYSDVDFIPSEYNGYTRCDIVKIINMILFFSNSCILKTKLFKEMFYADFMYYKMVGASITGLEYAKLPFGPVPNDYSKIIEICCKENLIDYGITYKLDLEYHEIKAKKDIDLSVFSEKELNILNKVKNFFADFSSKKIEDFSHKEKGYIETKDYQNISYDYAFDIESIK